MTLSIAHLVHITPHRSGLYETVREFAQEENNRGCEAKLISCKMEHWPPKKYGVDRGVWTADWNFTRSCDIVLVHQLPPADAFKSIEKP